MKRITINTPLVIRSVFGSYSDTITGTVFAGAAEAASSVVTFYRRTAGTDAWASIGSVTTSTASGSFSYSIPSGLAVGEYEWIAACGDAVSDVICQWVTNNTTSRQYRNPQRPVGSVQNGPDSMYLPDGWQLWDLRDESVKIRTDDTGTLWGDVFSITGAQIVANLYEPLRAANPGYITRTLLGRDQSDSHDIWKYEFTPPVYEKTIVVSSGTHGGETSAALALSRVFWHIVNNWTTYPQLSYLRHRVRIVLIPIVNPWGVAGTSGDGYNKTRYNSRGVDLARNGGYRWTEFTGADAFGHDYKGVAPFSEAESRIVRDLLAEEADAPVYIDFHNFGSTSLVEDTAPIYVTSEFPNATDVIQRVQEACRESASEATAVNTTYWPTLTTWAAYAHGMFSCSPEWVDNKDFWGRALSFDKYSFRRQVKFYGNILTAFARVPLKQRAQQQVAKKTVLAYWIDGSNDPVTFDDTSATEMAFLRVTLDGTTGPRITTPSLVRVTGTATMSSDTAGAALRASPRLYQDGAPPFGVMDQTEADWVENAKTDYFENYATASADTDVVTVPFVGVFHAYPTVIGRTAPVVGLLLSTSAGEGRLLRYRALIEIEPVAIADDAFTIFDAAGRETDGVGAMQKQWPKNDLFDPSQLFENDEAGVWFDPSDLLTLFTDTAGTTPASVGDAVARINDKSGNGYHATQATESKRPILRFADGTYYLDFDGTDDAMATGNVDLSGADTFTAYLGIRKDTGAARGTVVEQGNNETNTFIIDAPVGVEGVASPYRVISRGSAVADAFVEVADTDYYAPHSAVLVGQGDISADSVILRINGAEVDTGSADQGTGNFSNKPIYIGGRGGSSQYFGGRFFGLLVRNTLDGAAVITPMEKWLAAKSGVALA